MSKDAPTTRCSLAHITARNDVTAVAEAAARSTAEAIAFDASATTRSQQLASQSAAQLADNSYELALLLALEAGQAADTIEALNASYQALTSLGCGVFTITGPTSEVYGVVWSPDGSRFLTLSDDGIARAWDAETREQLTVLFGHEGRVISAAWSPDGRSILTASDDGTARVWDAFTGAELVTFFGQETGVSSAVWSPDSSKILTISVDGSAQLYYTRMEDVLEIACQCVTRNMTQEEWSRFMGNEAYRATCPNLPALE